MVLAVGLSLFATRTARGEEPQRTDNGDGTFSLVLPSGLETESIQYDGVFTWEYVGQARYRNDVSPPDNTEAVEPEYVLTSMWYDPEEYFGVGTTTQDDQYGRLWLLVDVDLVAAAQKISEYDALVEELWGAEVVGENPGIRYTENPGEIHQIDLQPWSTAECDSGDPGPEVYEHSNDDLDIISSTYNERQRKIVVVWLDYGEGSGQCSGVLVDNDTVLTAGHCIADEYGYLLTYADITVCSYGNVQSGAECIGASQRLTQGGTFNGNKDDDYALIHLSEPFSLGWFALSQADDSVIDDFTDFHRGYPGWSPSCDDNTVYTGVIDSSFPGAHQYMANGEIQATPSGYIKFDTSGADGMSGSPHFYCPNPDTDEDGDTCEHGHWITAVQGGNLYILNAGHSYGAKASDIRDWVITNL